MKILILDIVGRNFFNLESHMLQTMLSKYRICMAQHVDFWVVVIRLENQTYNSWQPPPNAIDWTEMSSKEQQSQQQANQRYRKRLRG